MSFKATKETKTVANEENYNEEARSFLHLKNQLWKDHEFKESITFTHVENVCNFSPAHTSFPLLCSLFESMKIAKKLTSDN